MSTTPPPRPSSILCSLFIICFFVILSILTFTYGFFLTRYELHIKSACSTRPSLYRHEVIKQPEYINYTDTYADRQYHGSDQKDTSHNIPECWGVSSPSSLSASSSSLFSSQQSDVSTPHQLHHINTLIFIIIDALRFDYLYYNVSSNQSSSASPQPLPYYSNQLLSASHALHHNPHHTRVYRQTVDPPTVTLQRLKGMTTGTLPTFIDISSNFNADALLQEDNWLEQFRHYGSAERSDEDESYDRNQLIHMGDDTWLSLFSTTLFSSTYPYPSFNVKDLHTVDNGVLHHIYEELDQIQQQNVNRNRKQSDEGKQSKEGKKERNLLIAHFLGVDHVGHRYEANHIEMHHKLQQMDTMIQRVMLYIDEIPGSMLMLLGDHGMTEDGNHGGASYEETNAGMLIYSHDVLPPTIQQRRRRQAVTEYDHVNVDNDTPTIETINQIDLVPTISYLLSQPIPYNNLGIAIESLIPSGDEYLQVIRENTWQVLRYLHGYQSKTGTFQTQILHDFTQRLVQIDNEYTATTMDTPSSSSDSSSHVYTLTSQYKQWLLDVTEMCRHKWTVFQTQYMFVAIMIYLGSILYIIYKILTTSYTSSGTQSMIRIIRNNTIHLIHPTGKYIKDHHHPHTCLSRQTVYHLLIHLIIMLSLLVYYFGLFTNSFTLIDPYLQRTLLIVITLLYTLQSILHAHTWKPVQQYGIGMALMVRTFDVMNGMTSDMLLNYDFYTIVQMVYITVGLLIWYTSVLYTLSHTDRVLSSLLSHTDTLILSLMFLSLYLHWCLPHHSSVFIRLILPQFIYLITFLYIFYHIVMECIHSDSPIDINTNTRSRFTISTLLTICYALLLGPSSTMLLLQYNIVLYLIYQFYYTQKSSTTLSDTQIQRSTTTITSRSDSPNQPDPHPFITLPILIFLLSNLLFYSSNHRPDFPRLHVSSVFVGYDNFYYYPAAIILMYNTFGHTILTSVGSTLILMNSSTSHSHFTHTHSEISRFYLTMILLYVLRGFCSVLNVTLQRHHLMVWAVFAPKMMFDCIECIVAIVMYTMCYTYVDLLFYRQQRSSSGGVRASTKSK